MMDFTHNDWGQRKIINKITIWTKQGTYTIHAVILTKYQKYPSTTILKHANVLAKLNYSLGGVYTLWHHMTLTVLQSTYA